MSRDIINAEPVNPAPRGPSKIVYVGEKPFDTDALTVIGPKQLDKLLEEGWTVTNQEQRKVSDPKGKKVAVDRITLGKVIERQISRRQQNDIVERGFLGQEERGVSTPGGHSLSHANSFLGGGSDFAGLPGVQMHSSRYTENAFGNGVDCSKTGGTKDDCPFPPSAAKLREEWMRGFDAGDADTLKNGGSTPNDKIAGEEAYQMGAKSAKGDKNLEVVCPYPPGGFLYNQWVKGFSENGGELLPPEQGDGL